MRHSSIRIAIGTALAAVAVVAATLSLLPAQTAPPPSLEQILKEISAFDGGIDSAPYWKLRDYVAARKDNPAARAECEARLLEFLGTGAGPIAKMAACRQLRLIGGDKSVPVLQALLTDKDSADMALYALARIPGSTADQSLMSALSRTAGPVKTAVIATLGTRKCRLAVPAIAALLASAGEFAIAAALALGEIGGEPAANALAAAFASAGPDLKPVIASALLECAEGLAAAKNERAAGAIYDQVLAAGGLPSPLRRAAMSGRIATSGERAVTVLMDHLKGSDRDFQQAAILKIKDTIKPEAIAPVCSLLPGLPEAGQVRLLAVLSGYPGDRVLPAVTGAAASNSISVRLAALKALEAVGDAATVPLLAEMAAKSRGPEQAAARNTLNLLKGRQVDAAVLELLSRKPAEDIQSELLLAVAERRMFTSKSAVISWLDAPSANIRIQALRTLRTIGTPSDMPSVLALLVKTGDDAERTEAETTTAALAQKISNPEGRSNSVKGMLSGEKDPKARVRLLAVLGRIGDDSSIPLLRAAWNDPNEEIADAAVRALVAWPSPAARDDVARLVQKSGNETHRLLALQGWIRMIGMERYRKPEAVVADLKQASLLASRPTEKRLILGILPRFGCLEALELASGFLEEPSLRSEAQAAVTKIKAQLEKK